MEGHQHQIKYEKTSTTARAAIVIVDPELSVHEMYSKVIELPHLACTNKTSKFQAQSR